MSENLVAPLWRALRESARPKSPKHDGTFTTEPVRIDADKLRELIPGYNGKNSPIVQLAASLAVEKVLDAVFEKRLPFMLDATFAVGKAIIISNDAFITAYFKSRENVQKVKREFGDQVTLHLIIKNYATGKTKVFNNVTDIAKHLPKLYNMKTN